MLKEEPRIFKLYSEKLSFLMFVRLECAVEQFFVVFRLDSVSCYVSYSNEYFNLLGKSVTNLLYQNIRFLLNLNWFLLRNKKNSLSFFDKYNE